MLEGNAQRSTVLLFLLEPLHAGGILRHEVLDQYSLVGP
jgi:hypothetical protein